VEQALWQKRIDEDIRKRVLDEVDDDEYLSVLRPLLKQKRKSTKANSDYELNQKLMRFALGRGFTFDIIRQCLTLENLDNLETLDNLEDLDDQE
jgi:regulatory protein